MIPRQLFFEHPDRCNPQFSPNGKYLSYLAVGDDGDVLNLWIRTIDCEDDKPITHFSRCNVGSYIWAPDSDQILFLQDVDGDENWRLFTISLGSDNPIDLTLFEGVQARIIMMDPTFPDEILVGINDRDPRWHDVYRINIKNGRTEMVAENRLDAINWIADHNLNVRIAHTLRADGLVKLMHRLGGEDSEEDEWVPLLAWDMREDGNTKPIGFAADNRTLYWISSIGNNTSQLVAFHVRTREKKVLASDSAGSSGPEADVSDLFIHPTNHEIQAVAFTKERKRWQILDDSIEDDFRFLTDLQRGDFTVISRDDDDQNWLVEYVQDNSPAIYFHYRRKNSSGGQECPPSQTCSSGTFLFSKRPNFEKCSLAETRPVQFTARDGLTIPAYLTLPVEGKPNLLPSIVHVHGGPWSRVIWGFDPEVQWLADRGYAVLQVNFRGSTGYGKDFINAGNRQWGGKMQDDITDAAEWLISEGIADSERIGIWGASYGGYAVLSGLTKTPELYACGVDLFGPSNLLTFAETIPPYWKPLQTIYYKRIGHIQRDREFLIECSPLTHVNKIQAPLLIAQGTNDPYVKRSESIQIRDALRAAGKTVQYIEFADEGHDLTVPQNRLTFYAAAEKFLAKYLGGRYQPTE